MGCLLAFVLIGIAGVVGIVALIGSGAQAVSESLPPTTTLPAVTKASPATSSAKSDMLDITYIQYDRVKPGMSYDDVFKVLGRHGKEVSRVEMPNGEGGTITTVMFVWENAGLTGANMNVTIQSRKVISKAQFGLK